jgi:hypothetical protein
VAGADHAPAPRPRCARRDRGLTWSACTQRRCAADRVRDGGRA